MAIGTIVALARRARSATPGLNALVQPSSLRVPSGNMKTVRPIASCWMAVRSAPMSPEPRSMGTAPNPRMSMPNGLKRNRLSRAMIVYGRSRITLPQTGGSR